MPMKTFLRMLVFAVLGVTLLAVAAPVDAAPAPRAAASGVVTAVPMPSISCGSGTCGNVRNIGTVGVYVTGLVIVWPGSTSRQAGVYDANSVTPFNKYLGIQVWQWYANYGNPYTVYRGCFYVPDGRGVPLGNADYHVRAVTGCTLG